jgi:hypothetical protein
VTPLAQGAFALLVVATFAAFFLAQRLKHSPTLVQGFSVAPSFTPTRGSTDPVERISFRIKITDYVTVTVLDSAGRRVSVLAHGVALKAYHQLTVYWNGHTAAGGLAPPGSYQVRVSLRRQNRSLVPPGTFRLLVPAGAVRT